MSCLLNRILTSRKYLLLAVVLAGNFFYAPVLYAQEDEAIKILERNTSAHWGQDCFVWVVHYPEEIVDAWVDAEARRTGMNDGQRARYRRNFIAELQLDTSETFLVSIYSFGSRPVNIAPADNNISLFTASGERIKPSRYDSSLDYPSAGIVQGLVFFPKQRIKDYVIGMRGMGEDERIFSFAPPQASEPVKAEKVEKKPEVVVVDLPKRQARKPAPKKKEPEFIPPPVVPPKPLPTLFNDNTAEMDAFVKSVQERGTSAPQQSADVPAKTSRPSNIDSAYVSRENVLRKFLALWADNNGSEMYDMLSENSKKQISRLNFMRDAGKDTAFRSGIKGGYKIDWIGEERAKITATTKTLVFKSVVTRTLGITREGTSWRVVW